MPCLALPVLRFIRRDSSLVASLRVPIGRPPICSWPVHFLGNLLPHKLTISCTNKETIFIEKKIGDRMKWNISINRNESEERRYWHWHWMGEREKLLQKEDRGGQNNFICTQSLNGAEEKGGRGWSKMQQQQSYWICTDALDSVSSTCDSANDWTIRTTRPESGPCVYFLKCTQHKHGHGIM